MLDSWRSMRKPLNLASRQTYREQPGSLAKVSARITADLDVKVLEFVVWRRLETALVRFQKVSSSGRSRFVDHDQIDGIPLIVLHFTEIFNSFALCSTTIAARNRRCGRALWKRKRS